MSKRESILTLEPLIEAVRDGMEAAGWGLSGLQKTTSHEYEGRWAGDSSRSAYLFFHQPGELEHVSVDVFLDETSKGLRGNLALVFDAPPLGEGPHPVTLLEQLRVVTAEVLPEGFTVPLSVRGRTRSERVPASEADVEVRVKLVIPKAAMEAGHDALAALCSATARSFEALCRRPEVDALME